MTGLADAVAQVVARFRTVTVNGSPLRCTDDPNTVVPPTVWVPLPDVTFRYDKGRALVTWAAFLVASPTPKQGVQTGHLAAIIDAVTGLFPFTSGDLYNLTLPGEGQPAPAYRLQWQSVIRIGPITTTTRDEDDGHAG